MSPVSAADQLLVAEAFVPSTEFNYSELTYATEKPPIHIQVTESSPYLEQKKKEAVKPLSSLTPGNPTLSKTVPKKVEPQQGLSRNYNFVAGQCTWFASRHFAVTWRGNAKDWANNARAQGYTVNMTPAVGAIVQTNESYKGHVGIITALTGDSIVVTEMNYIRPFAVSTRSIPVGSPIIRAVIHPR